MTPYDILEGLTGEVVGLAQRLFHTHWRMDRGKLESKLQSGICLIGRGKPWDLNLGPPKFESSVLPLRHLTRHALIYLYYFRKGRYLEMC